MSSPVLRPWPRSITPVLRRLGAQAPLVEGDIAPLNGLADRPERYRAAEVLIREGETTGRPRFLLSGWASRQRMLPDGRRQIFGFLLPGDGIGFCGPHDPPALASVVALTPIELMDGEPAHRAARADPEGPLARAMAVAARLEQAMLLDALMRLGRQTAYERVAHLLLELHHRLAVVGLAHANRFPMPLTQEILSDALGLSVVHVNRTLQLLRRDNLIELRAGGATLLDPDQLALIADYRAPRRS